jgi:NB-ARC domain
MAAHNIDARYSTNNQVGGNQYNTFMSAPVGSSSKTPSTSSLSFNDAPLDLLSVYFMGRDKELARIQTVLETNHGDIPTRCIVHGMHGLGKSQLALQFAKLSFEQRRYPLVFWMSATTVEKLNQGYIHLLNLVGHPDRLHPEQSARLTAARRWLEESGSVSWLLVLDNVDPCTLGFIRQNLPHKNRRGSILFTTRTVTVATALARASGQQHEVIELGIPDVEDAAHLFLTEGGMDVTSATALTMSKAMKVVRHVGCLPLAISHAASFMKESHKTLGDVIRLLDSEQIRVCSYAFAFCKHSSFVNDR